MNKSDGGGGVKSMAASTDRALSALVRLCGESGKNGTQIRGKWEERISAFARFSPVGGSMKPDDRSSPQAGKGARAGKR